jgi:hypothetical protein
MVISGKVSVRGILNGQPAADTAAVSVGARNWRALPVPYVVHEEDPTFLLSEVPHDFEELGAADLLSWVDDSDPSVARRVPSGPNTGIWLLMSLPVRISALIHINRAAMKYGSTFYWLQQNPPYGFCAPSEVVAILPRVIAHEGLNVEVDSHTEVYIRTLQLAAPQALERSLGTSFESLMGRAEDLFRQPKKLADSLHKDEVDGGLVPGIPTTGNCEFRYFRGLN